jgi:sugar O-acyltransferase (sialic acid O-acetyltransferase NeuD family)
VTVLVIVGAGDHGRVMADTARAMGRDPSGYLEPGSRPDNRGPGGLVDGLPVLGWLEDPPADGSLPANEVEFVVALGANKRRAATFERCLELGWRPVALVHPTVILLGSAKVAPGAQICAGAVIGLATSVGANVIVNTSATIDHDCSIAEHAFIGPGARLAGRVTVERGAHVGLGAIVRDGCRIGASAFVAAGAVVIQDVPAGKRVAGVPAQPMDPPSPSEENP